MSYNFTNPHRRALFHEIAMQLGGIKRKALLTEKMLMKSVDVQVGARRKKGIRNQGILYACRPVDSIFVLME